MQTTLRWRALHEQGMELLELRIDGSVQAQGLVIGEDAGVPYGLRYQIVCDAGWRTRALRMEDLAGRSVSLAGDGAGNWTDERGHPLPELAGAIDVDLAASAFTNTLTLRRLGTTLAERREIEVVYVTPELSCTRVRQAYQRLGPGRVVYEGLTHTFLAELEVDADDLVVRYPGLFERV